MAQSSRPSPFKPYWRRTGFLSEDPYCWVFFLVTRISGQHRPVAVASSKGDITDALGGYFLVAACQRLLTVLSSPKNRLSIQAEVALAPQYYTESLPERHELPEIVRGQRIEFTRPQRRIWEFPFISTCLLQGIRWNTGTGHHQADLEPLGTVYQDTSLVWGMVVVDITNLDSIEYGIVGFKVARMLKIESQEMDMSQDRFPRYGFFRVAEDERPRHPLSAHEFIKKFEIEMGNEDVDQRNLDSIDKFNLVSESALRNVWPISNVSSQDLGATSNSERAGDPYIKREEEETLKGSRIAQENHTVNAQERFCIQRGHMSLEHLDDPLPVLLLYTTTPSAPPVTSISVCLNCGLDSIRPLIEALSGFKDLEELVVVSRPRRADDTSSFAFWFQILALSPSSNLVTCRLSLSGLHSAGLEKRPWLKLDDHPVIKTAHYERYPLQQVLFHHTTNQIDIFTSAYLSDALLTPSRFINGFLESLHWIACYHGFDGRGLDSHLFVFSGCSSSLNLDVLKDSEITPLPAEASATSHAVGDNLSLVHDLDTVSWTVLVKHGSPRDLGEAIHPQVRTRYLRYAFVRSRKSLISVDTSLPADFTAHDLEILGLAEFLSIYSRVGLEADTVAIDRRLKIISEEIEKDCLPQKIPDDVSLVALMNRDEVLAELPAYLSRAKSTNEQIRSAMDKGEER